MLSWRFRWRFMRLHASSAKKITWARLLGKAGCSSAKSRRKKSRSFKKRSSSCDWSVADHHHSLLSILHKVIDSCPDMALDDCLMINPLYSALAYSFYNPRNFLFSRSWHIWWQFFIWFCGARWRWDLTCFNLYEWEICTCIFFPVGWRKAFI